ncbi:MAG: hypothetical protein WBG80_04900, partial [Bacteroidota bacterium]
MTRVRRLTSQSILGLFLTVLVLSSACTRGTAQFGITRVWAVDDGEKVEQTDLNHWASTDHGLNRVWDGTTIRVFGGRNEVVAFQVILEASGEGAFGVDLSLDSLVNGSWVITNDVGSGDLYDYVGRRIELFVEHYQEVTQRSVFVNSNGAWEARPLPDDTHQGWIPDALVPIEAANKRPAHGQGGAPFDIAGGRNQAIWVDVYIPKGVGAGVYRGTVEVREGGALTYSIPVELEVYGFTLPDETHQRNFFHWNDELLPNRYGIPENSSTYWSMFRKFMNVAHRHRMDLIPGRLTLARFSEYVAGYYTGEYYTPSYGYEGPGVGVGNRTYSIGSYDQPNSGSVSGFWPDTKEAWQNAADLWEQWFLDNAPGVLRFKYMHDEADVTDPDIVSAMQEKCSWIRSSPGVGKNLHRFFTKEFIYGGFYDYVDVWGFSGSPGIQLNVMRDRQSQYGELFCMYNGTRPMWGQMEVLDNFATDNRVNSWIAWKYGVDLLFLWQTSYYAETPVPQRNIWFENYIPGSGGEKSWGSGMWLYPGRDIPYPEDDRGVDGPITSIRMKNFRRGQQDYEYLWLAQEMGIDVSSLVDQAVPNALDDWGTSRYTNPPAYDQQPVYAERGHEFETVRRELASLIDQNGKTGSLPSGSLVATPVSLPDGGGDVTLVWSSTGAETAWLSHGIGNVPLNGSQQVSVDSTSTFILILTNESGTTVEHVTVSVGNSTEGFPAGSFVANPTSLPSGGGEVTLVWSSTDAISASISNGVGFVPVNGSTRVSVNTTSTFVLSLSNAKGITDVTVTVQVAPAGAILPAGPIAANPTSLPAGGGDVALVWSSTGAVSASLNHGIGSVPLSGSMQVGIDTTTQFVLTLTNDIGSSEASVYVGVADAQAVLPAGQIVAHPTHLP